MFHERITCAYLYVISKYGYPPDAHNTRQYLDEMKALGFSSVELEGIREEHLLGVYAIREQIADHIQQLGLTVPYFCTVLPGLTSLDDRERDHQLDLFDKGCQVAAMLGAKGVLDNAPLPPYAFPDDIPVVRHYHDEVLQAATLPAHLNWSKVWDRIVDAFRAACDIAATYRLTYQLHPAVGVLASTTDAFLYFHDAVKRDNLRFNLDTANQFVMKDNLALALRRLKDHIDYIHISDNRGTAVEHLPIGAGNIRWDLFFETLDLIDFRGHLGVDVGGDESRVEDLDRAYIETADFISRRITRLVPRRAAQTRVLYSK